jgi:hypothetical protein
MLPGNTTDKTTRRFTRVDHVGDHVGMAAGVLRSQGNGWLTSSFTPNSATSR